MLNVLNERHRTRLHKAIKTSRKTLQPFREERIRLIKKYAGAAYGNNTTEKNRDLANVLQLAAETYVLSLAINNPRVLISTRYLSLTSFARKFQEELNNLIVEIGLAGTIQSLVLDAFFGMGIAKTYLADNVPVELNGEWIDPGSPYVGRISPDDWFHDTDVNDERKWRFCGDFHEMYLEEALELDYFDQKVLKTLAASGGDSGYTEDEDNADQARRLSGNSQDDEGSLGKRIRLKDVWLPRERQLVTLSVTNESIGPLSVLDYDGPESGPFSILAFGNVPDNSMPLSKAATLGPLADLFNALYRKGARQAKKSREILAFEGGAEGDAKNILRSEDGDSVCVNRKDAIGSMKIGGIDPTLTAFTIGVRSLFSQQAGNLDAMAGLGPQSGTVGQDKLIKETVSAQQGHMAAKVQAFTADICKKLGWLLWTDQFHTSESEMRFDGLDFPVPSVWSPEDRQGEFWQYGFDIEPYSQAFKPPSQRANELTSFIMQVVAPLGPMLEAQGGSIDVQSLIRLYGELMNLPRLNQIIKFSQPQQPQEVPGAQRPGKPPVTMRHNVRHNVPTGGTAASRDTILQQALLSGSQNQDQERSLELPQA